MPTFTAALTEAAAAVDALTVSLPSDRVLSVGGANVLDIGGVNILDVGNLYTRALAEAATAGDATSAVTVTTHVALTEAAAAGDVTGPVTNTFTVILTEAAAAGDAPIAVTDTTHVTLTEAAAAVDTTNATDVGSTVSALAEFAMAADVLFTTDTYTVALIEASAATDALSVTTLYHLTLAEAAAAVDTRALTDAFTLGLIELATPVDSLVNVPSVFRVAFAEAALAGDSLTATGGAVSRFVIALSGPLPVLITNEVKVVAEPYLMAPNERASGGTTLTFAQAAALAAALAPSFVQGQPFVIGGYTFFVDTDGGLKIRAPDGTIVTLVGST